MTTTDEFDPIFEPGEGYRMPMTDELDLTPENIADFLIANGWYRAKSKDCNLWRYGHSESYAEVYSWRDAALITIVRIGVIQADT